MDRQERRIGLRALLAQRGQHDGHDLVEALEHFQQRRVEAAGHVIVGRGREFVVEAEAVEEGAQPRIVGRAERRVFIGERVGHLGQRLAEIGPQHVLVGHVVRHLAQAVHVVGKAQQPRLDLVLGQHAKGVPHHGRARDLAERSDMRQAGRPVAGLEQHSLGKALVLVAIDDLFGFLERPRPAFGGGRQHFGVEVDGRKRSHCGSPVLLPAEPDCGIALCGHPGCVNYGAGFSLRREPPIPNVKPAISEGCYVFAQPA